MADPHKNFAYSTILTAPSPATTGTSLTVGDGQGALFPPVPFNATIWPTAAQPLSTTAEIVQVTAILDDTFTIVRAMEGSTARTVVIGDQIAATITNATLTAAENVFSTWSPYYMGSAQSGVQTLASTTDATGTGWMFVFPVTVPGYMQFNQIVLANQLSVVTNTSNTSLKNTYYSKFGIYSMNANTLSLISSNSFSIEETITSQNMSWNYPTSTATSGYGYGGFPGGSFTSTGGWNSYLVGTRAIGLQFGGNMTLSGGVYWLGLLSQRSTSHSSTAGLSNLGIVGQIANALNSNGTVSGLLKIGLAASDWNTANTHLTNWWGHHVMGLVTATSLTNFSGASVPASIHISAFGGVAASQTGSILPTITFVST
jgi:hypothetical protein